MPMDLRQAFSQYMLGGPGLDEVVECPSLRLPQLRVKFFRLTTYARPRNDQALRQYQY